MVVYTNVQEWLCSWNPSCPAESHSLNLRKPNILSFGLKEPELSPCNVLIYIGIPSKWIKCLIVILFQDETLSKLPFPNFYSPIEKFILYKQLPYLARLQHKAEGKKFLRWWKCSVSVLLNSVASSHVRLLNAQNTVSAIKKCVNFNWFNQTSIWPGG